MIAIASGAELAPLEYKRIILFPHQIAVCDFICSGTVTSTNEDSSANVFVDEIFFGASNSTNITIRPIVLNTPPCFIENQKYLFLTFTNNWWSGTNGYNFEETSVIQLNDYLSLTNRPVDCAVFDDYRIMDNNHSAISFNRMNVGGTNFWPGIRSFLTKYIDVTRIQRNDAKARQMLFSTYKTKSPNNLPRELAKQLMEYYMYNLKRDAPSPEFDN